MTGRKLYAALDEQAYIEEATALHARWEALSSTCSMRFCMVVL